MKNAQVWGEDLTAFEGFLAAVEENIRLLNKGENQNAKFCYAISRGKTKGYDL